MNSSGFEDRREFDDFVKLCVQGAKIIMREAHGIVTEIEYRQVLKNNHQVFDGLMFKTEGKQAAPTVYINDAFVRYQEGESIDKIVRDITEVGYKGLKQQVEMPDLSDGFRDHLRLVVVNAEANEEMLQDTPHYKICDDTLAVYPRYHISGEASFRVTDSVCMSDQVMMSPSEVLEAAKINTKNLEYRVVPMSTMLHGILAETGQPTEELDRMMEQVHPEMVVITTMDGVYGSSCLLSEKALEQAKEMLGYESMLIIPSSIGEVIAVPDNGFMEPEAIAEMIREVNMTQLEPTEILGYEPMRWGPERRLTLAVNNHKIDFSKDMEQKMERGISMAMA
jgi:hypothetical protein